LVRRGHGVIVYKGNAPRHGVTHWGMTGLRSNDLVAFIPTTNPKRARAFFEKTLGLEFVSDDGFGLVFEAHGTPIRVVNVASVPSYVPAQFTILGWQVRDIRTTVRDLVN